MKKITNRQKDYRTRSKISNKALPNAEEFKSAQRSREVFNVDSCGYFIWSLSDKPKKI